MKYHVWRVGFESHSDGLEMNGEDEPTDMQVADLAAAYQHGRDSAQVEFTGSSLVNVSGGGKQWTVTVTGKLIREYSGEVQKCVQET